MIYRKAGLLLMVAVCHFVLPMSAEATAANSKPIAIQQILQTSKSWEGSDLPGFNTGTPEMQMFSYRIPPGARTPVHIHTINGMGYILSGELTVYATTDPHGSFDDPQKLKTMHLKAGDSWAEAVNVWHYGVNEGKQDVTLILGFAGPKDSKPTLTTPQNKL